MFDRKLPWFDSLREVSIFFVVIGELKILKIIKQEFR